MTKLEYTFKTDTLFKMLFVKYPEYVIIVARAVQGGNRRRTEKWQNVIADKDAEIARLREQLEKKQLPEDFKDFIRYLNSNKKCNILFKKHGADTKFEIKFITKFVLYETYKI